VSVTLLHRGSVKGHVFDDRKQRGEIYGVCSA